MALAIVEVLEHTGKVDQDILAEVFSRKYLADPTRGYGGMAHAILSEIASGADWRRVSAAAFGGTGSMGNGGAMRAAPIGAYFFDDLSRAADEASRAAEVTHANLEGKAGATAVAVAAASVSAAASSRKLLEAVIDLTPQSETRAGIEEAKSLSLSCDVGAAVSALGNGARVLAQDTVPFCLWCVLRHRDDFEQALWCTVSGLGDRDTTCAIVGGILSASDYGKSIPSSWMDAREPLSTLAGVGF
jgi:ADP-ribosylglycohydrolase